MVKIDIENVLGSGDKYIFSTNIQLMNFYQSACILIELINLQKKIFY